MHLSKHCLRVTKTTQGVFNSYSLLGLDVQCWSQLEARVREKLNEVKANAMYLVQCILWFLQVNLSFYPSYLIKWEI